MNGRGLQSGGQEAAECRPAEAGTSKPPQQLKGKTRGRASGIPIARVDSTFARNNSARCLHRATFNYSPTGVTQGAGEAVRAGGVTEAPKDARQRRWYRGPYPGPGQSEPEMAGHCDRVRPGRHDGLDRPACLARAAHRVVAGVTPTRAAVAKAAFPYDAPRPRPGIGARSIYQVFSHPVARVRGSPMLRPNERRTCHSGLSGCCSCSCF